MKYALSMTNRFQKERKLAEKRGLPMDLLEEVVLKLADGIPLPKKNKDHALTGCYAGYRECHIQADWLLMYKIEDSVLVLTLSRTGSHSDLFN